VKYCVYEAVFSPFFSYWGRKLDELVQADNLILVFAGLTVSLLGAGHALFNARDSRSAVTWIAICLMWPVVGVLIYLLLGKNRIRTRARKLHHTQATRYRLTGDFPDGPGEDLPAEHLSGAASQTIRVGGNAGLN
jgi:hypothetical protein